jgi:hypothetical protein
MYKKNNNRILKALIITAATTVFSVLLFSCATSRPDWISNYPADSAYYAGIGSSNTGNEAEDSEIARKRAMSNLAAEISAVIMSEVNYRVSEDSSGNVEEQAMENITQLVEQNLRAVETVDAWYSPDSGYWYYVRINKAEWLRIQQREMADIERRVKNLVEPVLGNNNRTVAEILQALLDGWTIVAESPYPGMIDTELMGERGALIDLLERQIALFIGSLTIDIVSEEISAEAGRPFPLVFNIDSALDYRPGQLQIDLKERDGSQTLMSSTTPVSGRYNESIDLSGLKTGKNYITAVLNTDVLGFKGKPIQLNPPKADFLIDVQKIKTRLGIDYTGNLEEFENEAGIYGSIRALISELLPVEVISSGTSSFEIDFKIDYRNAPPNDYGFTIIYAKANVSILRNGNSVFTYETAEAKGAGLNWPQANSKALEKMFEDMRNDSAFADKALSAFTVD